MPLSNKVISQFVKATNNDNKEKKETFVYGKISGYKGDVPYVTLDGSKEDTPISHFTSSIDVNDRVIVMIKNHEAIVTGNVTTEAATTKYIDNALGDLATALKADIEALWADYGKET